MPPKRRRQKPNNLFPAGVREPTTPPYPNEYALDTNGELLHSVIEYQGLADHILEQFNVWVSQILPKQIACRSLTIPGLPGHRVVFDNLQLPSKPSEVQENGQSVPLLPSRARIAGRSYRMEMYYDVRLLNAAGEVVDVQPKVFGGYIPVLLGSSMCHLAGKSAKELSEMGEDPDDPFGYGILNGSERVLTMQQKARMKQISITLKKGDKMGRPMASMTCSAVSGASVIYVTYGKINQLKLRMRIFGKTMPKTMPVISVIRFLIGGMSDDEIRTMFGSFTTHGSKIATHLASSFDKANQERSQDLVDYILTNGRSPIWAV